MGARNPDRIPIRMRRFRCETIADMQRERWDVISKCSACGLMMAVDLALVAKVSGPTTSLWNRKQRCRRLGCVGFVEFLARAPGMHMHELLSAESPADGWT